MKRLSVLWKIWKAVFIVALLSLVGSFIYYGGVVKPQNEQEIRGLFEKHNAVQVENSPYPAELQGGKIEHGHIVGNLVVTLPEEAVKTPPPQITRLYSLGGSYQCSFYVQFWTDKQLQTWSWYECTSFQGLQVEPREIFVRFAGEQ